MAVRIAKILLVKCDDPHLGLVEYLNSPLSGMDYSPTQLLMNRSTRTLLPVTKETLKPNIPNNAEKQLNKCKDRQIKYYNRGSKELPNVAVGKNIRYLQNEQWKTGTIHTKAKTPRSFIINTENDTKIRRNRKHIIPTSEHVAYKESIPHDDTDDDVDEDSDTNVDEDSNVDDNVLQNNMDNIGDDIDPDANVDEDNIRNDTNEIDINVNENLMQPVRRSERARTLPIRMKDYDLNYGDEMLRH